MGYDFKNDLPLYLQIIEHIKAKIISGEYCAGDRLKSVRELALEFEVNPNTIVKALDELEDVGLIFTERTNGKFVTKDKGLIEKFKRQTINAKLDEFFESMASLGIDRKQIIDILKGDN